MRKYKLPCNDCGSSDALTDYGDSTFCFSCNQHHFKDKKNNIDLEEFIQFTPKVAVIGPTYTNSLTPVDASKHTELRDRGINRDTATFYKVWINDKNEIVYPFYDLAGKKHVANQFRTIGEKGFLTQGEINKTCLFGQQLFPPSSAQQITVLEGCNDALAAYQMQGSKWPCVAVKSVSSAPREIANNLDYLNTFGTIVICFDNDAEHKKPDGSAYYPGQEAAEKVAAMFKPGKVRVLTLKDAKDANDYLVKGWGDKFKKEWWSAPQWTPQGIKLAKDLWDVVRQQSELECVSYPWDGLQELTYGMRLSEVVLITADTGVGKTSVVKELEWHTLKNSSYGVGILHLEESNKDTLLGLMSITANRPLHLPDVRNNIDDVELRKYFDNTCDTDKIVVWDHFGSTSIENILSTIRHMVALDCKFIILDHLSIVVSDQNGDERKQLDEVSTKLKQLCMELNCCIICVIHINRQGQVRGSAGPEQISNIVLRLVRDKLSENEDIRNTTKVTVEKNRFCGRTGPACMLKYDATTGRLSEQPKDSLLNWEETKTKAEESW